LERKHFLGEAENRPGNNRGPGVRQWGIVYSGGGKARAVLRLTRVKHLEEIEALLDGLSKLRANQENKKVRQDALDSLETFLRKLREREQKRTNSSDPRKSGQ
jgi:hypothetical protein